ncbi:cilia- and flagella-associated protein 263-like isoform X2 [Lasioglossum baleicum]|uniref:cilia- and flagella-associated protein 263-like isoform X2 n=1 Tax=Lasioglossum baleicum TaxID=434251 RepID=UPI003FCEC936
MAMARKEVEHMTKNFEDLKLIVQKRTMMMRAEIEELEIRISEVQEAKQEFEENVVIKGVDPITGKIPAERVTRYIEEWLKSANTIIGRLRLKSATHRMLITKTRQQLVQREELGEALRAVDFEQLNIQNKDYVRMIEEKTIYMLDMKKIAGHYHLKLTQHKQKLSDLLRSLNALKKETSEKDKQIRELHVEHAHVENDVAKVETELNNLVGYVDSHSVPEILEFVMLQKEVQSLQKKYKLLQRRRYVEQILFQASLKYIYSKASQSRLELMSRRTSLREDAIISVKENYAAWYRHWLRHREIGVTVLVSKTNETIVHFPWYSYFPCATDYVKSLSKNIDVRETMSCPFISVQKTT